MCNPHETVFSQVGCPAAHVGPVPQVVIGAHVCPLAHVTEPVHVAKPGQVFTSLQVGLPHVTAGAQVTTPLQLAPNALHVGLAAHDAELAHDGSPGIVGVHGKAAHVCVPPQLGDGATVG